MTYSHQEVADRLEIMDLIARYSVALDSRDYDALDGLFTDDAVLDYRATGAIKGSLAEMKEFVANAFTMFEGTQHLTTGTTLTFSDDGNTITALCQLSQDGNTWEGDLDLNYQRVVA